MIAIVNDLPFYEQFASTADAKKKVLLWLKICKKLESAQTSEIDELCGEKIDMTRMIAPDCCLAQVVKGISNRDEMRYMIHLLKHLRNPVMPTTEPFQFAGIATQSHILENGRLLGIRHYEANPKHRKEAYWDAAGRYVEAMDLDDAQAQEALNHAVTIDNNLYGKKYGQYYCFQRHHENCYHGYQNNNLPLHIKNQIDRQIND